MVFIFESYLVEIKTLMADSLIDTKGIEYSQSIGCKHDRTTKREPSWALLIHGTCDAA